MTWFGRHTKATPCCSATSTSSIEELVARLAPQPDVPTTLRALPSRTPTAPTVAAGAPAQATLVTPALAAPSPAAATLVTRAPAVPAPAVPALAAPVPTVPTPGESAPVTVASAPAPRPPRPDATPSPSPSHRGRYKLTVTISESTRDKFEQLKDLLAHEIPKGDLGVILDRALDALLTEVHKQKTGIGAKPRAAEVTKPTPSGQQTRHVKPSARREVWPRDQGRCGFVGEDGHRCNETRGLHFAHRKPFAKGGANTAENLGLRVDHRGEFFVRFEPAT